MAHRPKWQLKAEKGDGIVHSTQHERSEAEAAADHRGRRVRCGQGAGGSKHAHEVNEAEVRRAVLTLSDGGRGHAREDTFRDDAAPAAGFAARRHAVRHGGRAQDARLQCVAGFRFSTSVSPSAVCCEVVGPLLAQRPMDRLASADTDAALVVDPADGCLKGIITDSDVTRKVLAKGRDPSAVRVTEVMTVEPVSVSYTGTAFDALVLMVEGMSAAAVLTCVTKSAKDS